MPTYNANLLPNTTGLDLGSTSQRWDVVAQSGDFSTNVNVTGTLTTGAQTVASESVTGNATVGGTLGVTGATSLSSVSTSGNGTVGGNLAVTGTSALTGNVTAAGTLGVTGLITATGGVSGALNGIVGGTTPAAGSFTTLGATGVVSFGTAKTTFDANGILTKYNTWTTAGKGVPPIYAVTSQKAETAADTSVLSLTPPAEVGTYRVNFVLSLSAANSATLGWTMTWKDSNGNAQSPTNLSLIQTGTAAPALTFTTSSTGNYHGSAIIDVDSSGTAIVVKTTFSGTSFAGKASATIERIQ